VASIGGPVLVQGALVLIVESVHEAERPPDVATLFVAAGRRFFSLLGAAIVYPLGILLGLVALIVPGLIAAARWCLMAPGIMLEERGTFDALERSRELVRGRTWPVFGVVFWSFLLTGLLPAFFEASAFRFHTSNLRTLVSAVISSLTAPYAAHVLSVLYYRL